MIFLQSPYLVLNVLFLKLYKTLGIKLQVIPYKFIQGLESLQVVLVRELIIEYDGILIRVKVQ